ncbi:MAG: hypothetical protein IJT49_08335 [Clostridia bacterium]|nr:hypothetical protein [Clostridia bacterium]
MKTLNEFIKEINGSKDLQEELKNTNDMDAANAFLKKHDCDATANELAEYIRSQRKDGVQELSDDEVSAVAGGIWADFGYGLVWLETEVKIERKKEEVLEKHIIEIIDDD